MHDTTRDKPVNPASNYPATLRQWRDLPAHLRYTHKGQRPQTLGEMLIAGTQSHDFKTVLHQHDRCQAGAA